MKVTQYDAEGNSKEVEIQVTPREVKDAIDQGDLEDMARGRVKRAAFHEFVKTRRWSDDLEPCGGPPLAKGFRYGKEQMLWIMLLQSGQFDLVIGNYERADYDLDRLEWELYNYAVSEELL